VIFSVVCLVVRRLLGCRRTHVLLSSWFAPRRADAIEVIGTAAGMALAGRATGGSAPGRASRPRPCAAGCAGSAPGPRRCARPRCTCSASSAGSPVRRCQAPAASPLGEALNAVAACAHAAITRFGLSRADLWPLLGRFGLARHLAPARAG